VLRIPLAAALLALGGLPAGALEAPGAVKAAADKLKVERTMRLQSEVERVCDELEPLVQRLAAMESLYGRNCRLSQFARERAALSSSIGTRIENLNAVMGELKNARRAEDIVSAIEASQGRRYLKSAPEVYFERSMNSSIERFARVKSQAELTLSREDAAFNAARKDCSARAARHRWAASLLAVLALAALAAWRLFGRTPPAALLLFLLPAFAEAADLPEESAGRAKIQGVMKLREDADVSIIELDESILKLGRLRTGYPPACGIERFSVERELLRTDVLGRMTKLNSVKNALFDIRRTNMYMSLLLFKRQQNMTETASRPEAIAFFERACNEAIDRVRSAHGRASQILTEEEDAFKAAGKDCAARKRQIKWLAASISPFLVLGAAAWLISLRKPPAAALLLFLFPALAAKAMAANDLRKANVQNVMKVCAEADAAAAELDTALGRLGVLSARYVETCRHGRIIAERKDLNAEIKTLIRRVNTAKNDLLELRRNDMFVSLVQKNDPRDLAAAVHGGARPRATGHVPKPEAADAFFTKSYDAGTIRARDAMYRAIQFIEQDEVAFQAAEDACYVKKRKRILWGSAAAGACILAAALWAALRGKDGSVQHPQS
jgi:hypothetical protein